MGAVLVVGGAGFIGSHMVKMLARSGRSVVTFDNLTTGHREDVVAGAFVRGNLLCAEDLRRTFSAYRIDVVMHFSGSCYVGESMQEPRKYYRNNVLGTINLLDAMLDAGVMKIVFSSSCATYGSPLVDLIDETHPQRPVNPYGWTKLMVEQIFADYARAYGIASVSLRYFNAAGSDPEGEIGERHDPEPHLIPLVLREALRVKRGGNHNETQLFVNGKDFDTPDGTCIRDYIHVEDICRAHMLAASHLEVGSPSGAEAFNLGNGRGFSVEEIIRVCQEVTGVSICYKVAPRRLGDPPRLVGNADKAKRVLGWEPEYSDIRAIVETAWRYMSRG